MEKHYTEFDCDYCRFYPCSRFQDKVKGKIILRHCGDFEEDPNNIFEEENKNKYKENE